MAMHCIVVILALIATGRSMVSASKGRVTLGYSVTTFSSVWRHIDHHSSDEMLVYSIQEDKRETGKLLAAIGSAIYTIDKDGYANILVGNAAGNADGHSTSARFNQTAGFVQLSRNSILISDRNNHCIRKLNRNSGQVTTYAGVCGTNVELHNSYSYSGWNTFNSPSRLSADTSNHIYVLDVIDGESVIVSKNLNTAATTIKRDIGTQVNDFIHDSNTSSFIVSSSAKYGGVYNVSHTGVKTDVSSISLDSAYGLAYADGILLVTDKDKGVVEAVDVQQNNRHVFTLCSGAQSHSDDWDLPYCSANKPTAVAVIGGLLYFSSSENDLYDSTSQVVYIKRVSFTTVSLAEYTRTATTTGYLYTSWDSIDAYSYDSSSSTNSSGGTTAVIVIVCILAVAVKISCIVCCIVRWTRRRHCHAASTTIIAVSQPSTTVVQHSTVPYDRMQESYNPDMEGQFPAPPAYVLQQQHQQQPQQHQQQPQQQQPKYAPPAYASPQVNRY